MDACLCLSIDSFLANHERLKARYYITMLHLVRRVWSINWTPVTSLHFQSFVLLHKRSLTDVPVGRRDFISSLLTVWRSLNIS